MSAWTICRVNACQRNVWSPFQRESNVQIPNENMSACIVWLIILDHLPRHVIQVVLTVKDMIRTVWVLRSGERVISVYSCLSFGDGKAHSFILLNQSGLQKNWFPFMALSSQKNHKLAMLAISINTYSLYLYIVPCIPSQILLCIQWMPQILAQWSREESPAL